jgi:ferric-dicitrate binding protein FerR (iron transport regulator)
VNYHNLIIKFFTDEISEDEIVLLKSWLESSPDNRRIFNEENELWQEASIKSELGLYRTDSAWKNISVRLGFIKDNMKSVTIISKLNIRLLVAAAIVALLISIGALSLWIKGNPKVQQVLTASTTITTDEGEKANVILPDYTKISLNSGSSIQYNGDYNITNRKVKLKGEAYFDVKTNPEKPFVVQLDQMSISATGTRFNVFSYTEEGRIETTLEEGKIQVLIKGKDPIFMKSGQQVVYFGDTKKFLVRNVTADAYTSWKDNKLRFNDTPFEEVLWQIGRWYNVNFEITDRDLLNLKFTATFIDESIEQVMQMLKKVSPITYQIQNRTSVKDKLYQKPKITIGKRKT